LNTFYTAHDRRLLAVAALSPVMPML